MSGNAYVRALSGLEPRDRRIQDKVLDRLVASNPLLWLSWLVITLAFLAALFPNWLSAKDPLMADIRNARHPPGLGAPFGTDELGRDVLSRVIHGASYSLGIGVGATAIAVLLGVAIGLVAALGGRILDTILMRACDLVLAFPSLLFALVVIAAAGPGQYNVMLAIACATTPVFARLVRTRVRLISRAEYVEASVVLGVRTSTIVWKHILPNALAPLVVVATTGVGNAIILGAGLSFLGLGAQPPNPEWGLMLANSRGQLGSAWWDMVFPGLALTTVVIAFTVAGRELEQRLQDGDR